MSNAPDQVETAWGLLRNQRFAEALALSARLLAVAPDNVSVLVCQAMALWQGSGDMQAAAAGMRRAVELAPREATIRHNYGLLLNTMGEVAAAEAQFRAALEMRPDDTMAFWGLTQNHRFRDEDALVRSMVALHADPAVEGMRRQFLAYALAKVFDDLGAHEAAMGYALEANRLDRRGWDLAGERQRLEEARQLLADDRLRHLRSSGHPSRAPLFIVGMPRSGTTLIETMLSRHPDVLALGESLQIPEIETRARARHNNRGGNGPLLAGLDRDFLKAEAEGLLRNWTGRASRPFRVVTDKLPDNAMLVGLIRQLLPGARILHMRRHPLDTGVSNFFQRFASGQGFANRLDWIGLRTRHVADSMATWKAGLDIDILEVGYEALVADPEAGLRRVLDFAGLDWCADCLSPEQSRRGVGTSSQWQVRQPIYRRAVGRWQRYEPWLGPMIEAMGGPEWIATETAAFLPAAEASAFT